MYASELLHKIHKTEGKKVLKFVDKIFKNKSSEDIVKNPKLLIYLACIDRWGEEFVEYIEKDNHDKSITLLDYDIGGASYSNLVRNSSVEDLEEITAISMEIHKKNKDKKSIPSYIELDGREIMISHLIFEFAHDLEKKTNGKITAKDTIKRILSIEELKINPRPEKELKDIKDVIEYETSVSEGKMSSSYSIIIPDTKDKKEMHEDESAKIIMDLKSAILRTFKKHVSTRYYSPEELKKRSIEPFIIGEDGKEYQIGQVLEDGGVICQRIEIYSQEDPTHNLGEDVGDLDEKYTALYYMDPLMCAKIKLMEMINGKDHSSEVDDIINSRTNKGQEEQDDEDIGDER